MLTPKKLQFVKEYLIDLNATEAAKRAGYSKATSHSQGPRLLEDVEIQKLVQAEMDKRAARANVTAEYVLSTILETIDRCRQVKPVLNRKGEPVVTELADGTRATAFTFDAGGVLKGTELLGKHLKLFTDKVEQSGPDGGAIPLDVTIKFGD